MIEDKKMTIWNWCKVLALLGFMGWSWKQGWNIEDILVLWWCLWSFVFVFESRISSGVALIFLVLCLVFLILENQSTAEVMAVYVFYFLVITVFTQIRESAILEQVIQQNHKWLYQTFLGPLEKITQIKLLYVVGSVILGSFVLITGRYFVDDGLSHNFFLDLGEMMYFHGQGSVAYMTGWNWDWSQPFNYLSGNILSFLVSLLAWIKLSILTKMFQLGCIAVSGLGSFLVFGKLVQSDESNRKLDFYLGLLVSLVYIFNPFYFSVLSGVWGYTLAYALIPWVVFLWILILEDSVKRYQKWITVLTLGAVLSFATLNGGVLLLFTNGIGLGVLMLALLFANQKSKNDLIHKSFVFGLVWILSGMGALYYLAPTMWGYKVGGDILQGSQVEERVSPFVKDFYSPTLTEIVFLQNKEGIVSGEIGYRLENIPLHKKIFYGIFGIIALGSIVLVRRKSKILPFWVTMILSGYLALGYSSSYLYRLLNDTLPYFWGLRTPGRFMMVMVFCVAILVGLAIRQAWGYAKNSKGTKILVAVSIILFLGGVYNARHFGAIMYTFRSVSGIDSHIPGASVAQDKLKSLIPNQEYRLLDLSRDDDGSWHHTRVLSKGQRIFYGFEEYLDQVPKEEWLDVLTDFNVKYVVTTSFGDYCDDKKDKKNRVACLFGELEDVIPLAVTEKGYVFWEIPNVRAYASSERLSKDFDKNLQWETKSKDDEVLVAEKYSPYFQWVCDGEKQIATQCKDESCLVQKATLPANSTCQFRYIKPFWMQGAEWISYTTLLSGVVGGIFLLVGYATSKVHTRHKQRHFHIRQKLK
jgi:hypothetical protein